MGPGQLQIEVVRNDGSGSGSGSGSGNGSPSPPLYKAPLFGDGSVGVASGCAESTHALLLPSESLYTMRLALVRPASSGGSVWGGGSSSAGCSEATVKYDISVEPLDAPAKVPVGAGAATTATAVAAVTAATPTRGMVEVCESAVARSRQWATRQGEVRSVSAAAARARAREVEGLWAKWLKAQARHQAADRALVKELGLGQRSANSAMGPASSATSAIGFGDRDGSRSPGSPQSATKVRAAATAAGDANEPPRAALLPEEPEGDATTTNGTNAGGEGEGEGMVIVTESGRAVAVKAGRDLMVKFRVPETPEATGPSNHNHASIKRRITWSWHVEAPNMKIGQLS